MGAIQSAINSGLTTTAAAIGAAKKLNADTEKLKTESAIQLADVKTKIKDIKSDIKANKALTEAASKGYNMDKTTYDPMTDSYTGEYDLTASDKTISYNVAKQKQALQSLQGELRGLNMQKKNLTKFLKRGVI